MNEYSISAYENEIIVFYKSYKSSDCFYKLDSNFLEEKTTDINRCPNLEEQKFINNHQRPGIKVEQGDYNYLIG